MLHLLPVSGSGVKSRILADPEPQHSSLNVDICRALKEAAAVINESPSALQVKSDCLSVLQKPKFVLQTYFRLHI
jgi:hypothetical protein